MRKTAYGLHEPYLTCRALCLESQRAQDACQDACRLPPRSGALSFIVERSGHVRTHLLPLSLQAGKQLEYVTGACAHSQNASRQ